jgi:hypothetical protein
VNTAGDVPDVQRQLYEEAIDEIARESPSEMTGSVSDDRFDYMMERAGDYGSITVEDEVSNEYLDHDDPQEFLEWKLREDWMLGDLYHFEDDGKHPVMEFENGDGEYDEHFLFIAVHPERKEVVRDRPIPEVNMYGISLDSEEDTVYFGGMALDDMI